jgi:hypothetical protein
VRCGQNDILGNQRASAKMISAILKRSGKGVLAGSSLLSINDAWISLGSLSWLLLWLLLWFREEDAA